MISVCLKMTETLYTLCVLKGQDFKDLELTASKRIDEDFVTLSFTRVQWKDATMGAKWALQEVVDTFDADEDIDGSEWGYVAFDSGEHFLDIRGNLLSIKILGA